MNCVSELALANVITTLFPLKFGASFLRVALKAKEKNGTLPLGQPRLNILETIIRKEAPSGASNWVSRDFTTLKALHLADTHDAIIVGAGAAGGLAAMLLTESGLRVLVLDAGPPPSVFRAPLRKLIGHVVQQFSTPEGIGFLPPTLIPTARGAVRMLGRRRQPVQSRCYAWERAPNAFVDDRDCPYVTPPNWPFVWVRTRMLGGRVAVPGHGRQYYRLGPDDLIPNDGLSTPWPLQPYELDPWYSLVEDRLGLSGMCDGLPWLPDSELVNVLSPTPSEAALQQRIKARWAHARPILGRYAPPLGSKRPLVGPAVCNAAKVLSSEK